jgi:hypothetical protein
MQNSTTHHIDLAIESLEHQVELLERLKDRVNQLENSIHNEAMYQDMGFPRLVEKSKRTSSLLRSKIAILSEAVFSKHRMTLSHNSVIHLQTHIDNENI